MKSLGGVEGPFSLIIGVELLCNISVEMSVELFFGSGETCPAVRKNKTLIYVDSIFFLKKQSLS